MKKERTAKKTKGQASKKASPAESQRLVEQYRKKIRAILGK